MTEKQRIKLEQLIDEYEIAILHTRWVKNWNDDPVRKRKEGALKNITDYLTVIQNNCISLGCYSDE